MKITYKGNYTKVQLAVEDANKILGNDLFYKRIREHVNFSCSKKTPEEIATIIQNTQLQVEVKFYKPRWRWSQVLGYFANTHPNTIFLNVRKLNRETNSISNTIIHEYIHALDFDNSNELIEFGHNCNYFENTAPYEIGNIAETIINNDTVQHLTEHGSLIIEEDRIIENY